MRFLAICGFLVVWLSAQAQLGTYERFAEVLINSTYNSADNPVYLPSTASYYQDRIVKNPKNGFASTGISQGVAALELFINYTPDAGFVGLDTIVVEVTVGAPIQLAKIYFAKFILHVVPSQVTTVEDYYTIPKGSQSYYLPVISNDNSTAPNLAVQQVAAAMGGIASIANDSLLFTPHPEFEGTAYLSYTACDSVNTCKTEIVNICVLDTVSPEAIDTISWVTAITRDLSGFLPSSNFYLTAPPVNGSVDFIPNSDAFVYHPGMSAGTDVFEVSDGNSIRFYSIDVLPYLVNSFAFDDYAAVVPGDKIDIFVKENDLSANFNVSDYSLPVNGTLIEVSDGHFSYEADTSFTGTVTFDYEVCALRNCETATVYITVSSFAPKEVGVSYELTGLINRDLLINYDVPVDNYTYSITNTATSGYAEVLVGLDTFSSACVTSIGRFMITYNPDSGFSGWDSFTLTYCSDNACTDVDIAVNIIDIPVYDTCQCLDQCVWPGDINFDGEVDMTDLLSLGQVMGDAGSTRPNPAPGSWYGQYGPDWNNPLRGTALADEKHGDADGDGFITVADTAAIGAFFGKHHTLIPEQEFTIKPYLIGLEHDLDTTPSIGDTITLYLTIGNSSNPVHALSGVGMSLSFNPNTVDSAYTKITPVRENWLTREGLPLFMSRDDDVNFTFGLTRIDHESNHGYGRVFAVDIIIDDDLDGLRPDKSFPVKIYAHDIVGLDAEGKKFIVPNQQLSFLVKTDDLTDDKAEAYDFNVYPNPVQDVLYLDIDASIVTELHIADMKGRSVMQLGSDVPQSISTEDMLPGMYLIQARTTDGVKTAKFFKLK